MTKGYAGGAKIEPVTVYMPGEKAPDQSTTPSLQHMLIVIASAANILQVQHKFMLQVKHICCMDATV